MSRYLIVNHADQFLCGRSSVWVRFETGLQDPLDYCMSRLLVCVDIQELWHVDASFFDILLDLGLVHERALASEWIALGDEIIEATAK